MTPADFIATYGQYAQQIGQQTHIDPSVILGVISTETGAGEHIAGNNLGGISPSGLNGQYVAGYPDVETGGRALVDLLNSKRYANVQNAQGPDAQAIALQLAGYNSVNPNYGVQVADSAASYRTAGFNKQPPAAAPAAAAPAATDAGPSVDDVLNLRGLGSKPQTPQAPVAGPSVDDVLKLRPNMTLTPPGAGTGTGSPVSGAPISPQEAAMPAVDPQMPGRFTNPATPAPAGPGAIPQTGLGSAVGTIWDTAKAIPSAIGAGASEGFNNPNLLTPQAQRILDTNVPTAGTAMHYIAPAVGGAFGALSGAFQGGLNTLAAVGNDMLPPDRGGSFGNALGGVGEYEATRAVASPGIGEVPFTRGNEAAMPPIDTNVQTAKPTTPPVVDFMAAKSAADRADALDARATTGKPPQTDNTQYVPGTTPALAERSQTPANVAQYDALKRHDPTQTMGAMQDNNNDARVQYATTPVVDANGDTVSGADTSAGTYAALRANRSAQATQDVANVFKSQQPVSTTDLTSGIASDLKGTIGQRPVIAGPLTDVLNRIKGVTTTTADGSATASPDMLYAVRQSIDDMLDRSNPNNAGNIQAQVQLQAVKDKLDGLIQQGTALPDMSKEVSARDFRDWVQNGQPSDPPIKVLSPIGTQGTLTLGQGALPLEEGPFRIHDTTVSSTIPPGSRYYRSVPNTDFQTYLNNYRANSQPINQIDALRDAGYDNMTNAQGVMTKSGVQNVIDNLRGGVRDGDLNAMNVGNAPLNTLFNLRDDLARKEALVTPAGNMRSGALQGSLQQRINLEKQATSGGVMRNVLGLGGQAVTAGTINALVSGGLSPLAGTAADMAANIFGKKVNTALGARAGRNLLNTWKDNQTTMHPDWGGEPPKQQILGINRKQQAMAIGIQNQNGLNGPSLANPQPAISPNSIWYGNTPPLPLSMRNGSLLPPNTPAPPGMDDGGLVDVTQLGDAALTGMANDPAYSGQGGAALNAQMRDNANAKILRDREGEQKARGGLIGGGPPGRDTVPVHLSNGEFVVRRQSVAALGVKHLAALNEMHKMPAAKQARIRNALQGVL